MSKSPRVLLIIPCFNESGSIATLLHEIESLGAGFEVVVIDDGSSDNTFAIASALAPTVRLVRNLGIGGAVQTGIKYAERNGYDFCVQIDGDGQHPPAEVAKLLEAYRNQPREIIIGSRYIDHDTFRSTWARRAGSQLIARFINALFDNACVTDPTSGMRLMDRRAMVFFARHYPQDFPEPISLAWALDTGMQVGEVPVQMRAREHGQSSIIGWKPIAYMFRVLCYLALARFIGLHPSK
jgi:glycosyltransferase involved in cell wall biosynthesis